MKRKLLLMLLCAALGLGAAQAEVYRVENEADVPADWAEKDTLRLTCIDTNRSDWRRRRIDAGQRKADDFPLPPADGAEQPQRRLHGAVRGFAGVPDRRY